MLGSYPQPLKQKNYFNSSLHNMRFVYSKDLCQEFYHSAKCCKKYDTPLLSSYTA